MAFYTIVPGILEKGEPRHSVYAYMVTDGISFYLRCPTKISKQTVILVPQEQFEDFLRSINKRSGLNLKMPTSPEAHGFGVTFAVDGTPRPRYLGRSTGKEIAEGLKIAVPSSSYRPESEPYLEQSPDDVALDCFKQKIKQLTDNDTQRKLTARAKKKIERQRRQQACHKSIEVTQQYLGLIPTADDFHALDGWAMHTTTLPSLGTRDGQSTSMETFDVNVPIKFTQHDSVVFISVDVESYERNHNLVTEIGIATLDSADVVHLAPGHTGERWRSSIRAKHFRILEHSHLKNKDFVHGCPDYFQFGSSDFVALLDVPATIAECFRPYRLDGRSSTDHASERVVADDVDIVALSMKGLEVNPTRLQKRNIVLVGHDVNTDINYLKAVGYDIHNLSTLTDMVDTSSMYRALSGEEQPKSLGSILAALDIPGLYLHNAGNDAVYTLQAMLGIAIKHMEVRRVPPCQV